MAAAHPSGSKKTGSVPRRGGAGDGRGSVRCAAMLVEPFGHRLGEALSGGGVLLLPAAMASSSSISAPPLLLPSSASAFPFSIGGGGGREKSPGPRVCAEADWCFIGGRSGLAWSSRRHGRRGSPRGWRFADGATWRASKASPIWARGRGQQGGQAWASAQAGEAGVERGG